MRLSKSLITSWKPVPALSSLPIVAALDHVEVPLDEVTAPMPAGAVVSSLVEALSRVPDPRAARGVRHGVLAVSLIGACAVLAGARLLVAVAEYAHDGGRVVLSVLGVGAVVPHESTSRRVLQQIDASALEAALQAWALAHLTARAPEAGTPAREQRRVFALDGKTVRDARTRDGEGVVAAPHLVSVIDQASGVVLGQVQVDAKGSEVAAAAGPRPRPGRDPHDHRREFGPEPGPGRGALPARRPSDEARPSTSPAG